MADVSEETNRVEMEESANIIQSSESLPAELVEKEAPKTIDLEGQASSRKRGRSLSKKKRKKISFLIFLIIQADLLPPRPARLQALEREAGRRRNRRRRRRKSKIKRRNTERDEGRRLHHHRQRMIEGCSGSKLTRSRMHGNWTQS